MKRKWEQLTLEQSLGVPAPRPPVRLLHPVGAPRASTGNRPLVVELFCGLGGWAEGSRRAGLETVLAVDCDMALLRLHKANHPRCTQCQMVLGPRSEADLVRLIRAHVPPGRAWHLHGSPPCQRISCASAMRGRKSTEEGMGLVLWYLALVLRLDPPTWSMEEVSHAQLTGALAMARQLRPDAVDFVPSLCMGEYGVPQHRKRCIAGTPRVVRRLRDAAELRAPAPALRDVVAPPPGAAVCMSPTGRLPDRRRNVPRGDGTFANATIRRCMRPVDAVAWTCTAGNRLIWCTADYRVLRRFTIAEQLAVQTFARDYRVGRRPAVATVGVGQAVPPLFARKFMACL